MYSFAAYGNMREEKSQKIQGKLHTPGFTEWNARAEISRNTQSSTSAIPVVGTGNRMEKNANNDKTDRLRILRILSVLSFLSSIVTFSTLV